MKLSQGTLRPGRVIEVLENGEIRAAAPGLFSEQDKDQLPPILPFPSWHANTYSAPKIGDEVWVLNFMDNPLQLHWFRKDNYKENLGDIIKEENVDVICHRETPMSWATIYFSDGSGWIIRNDESVMQIDKDGNINISRPEPHRTISITEDVVSIGGTDHPAVYGDVLQDILQKIQMTLELVQKVSASNAITAPIGTAIGSTPTQLATLIPQMISPHVKLD